MSKKLNIYKEFTFGVGTGEHDLLVTGISNREEYQGIDIDGILGSGEIRETIRNQGDYSQHMSFSITPGYFYVGDRECYAYGRKCTQITHPVYSSGSIDNPYPSGIMYLALTEVPDGMISYALPGIDNPGGKPDTSGGAAPINVSRFEPGVLSAHTPLYDTIIYHDTGVSSLPGYREIPETGEFIEGDDPTWPAYCSPLSRFTVFNSYWRENDPMLPPDQYIYDFEYNAIILYDSGTLDHEYIIEFEGLNEPFDITELNISPLESWPENSILCLTLDDTNTAFTEEPYEIVIHTSKTIVQDETIPIFIEVRSITGNRLEGEDIRIRIVRPEIAIHPQQWSSGNAHYYEGSPYAVCSSGNISGVIIDAVQFPSGVIYEGNVCIANEHRINNAAYVRSAGYLCYPYNSDIYLSGSIPEEAGYELVVTTDVNGIGTVWYHAPYTISSSFNIIIRAEIPSNSGIIEELPIALISNTEEVCYSLPVNDFWTDRYIREHFSISGEYCVRLPLDCISPSSAGVISIRDYCQALYSGVTPPYIYPSALFSGCVETSGELFLSGDTEYTYSLPWTEHYRYIDVVYSDFTPSSGEPIVVHYPVNKATTRGDSRDTYGY